MPTRHIPEVPAGVDATTIELPLVEGPWMEDRWVVVDAAGESPRHSRAECRVVNCDSQALRVGLCHGHFWRWRRDGEPDVTYWSQLSHSGVGVVRGVGAGSRRAFEFTSLPPRAAEEIRYVVGFKMSNGDWTANTSLRAILELLAKTLLRQGAISFSDRRAEDWILLARETSGANASFDRSLQPYLRSFFAVLNRGLVADPWAEQSWLWMNMFDRILGRPDIDSRSAIHWGPITQVWLRDPLKDYAREMLVSGQREWSTIGTWAKTFRRFSEFLARRRITSPVDVNRKLFLLHLEEQLALHTNATNMKQAVNTLASVLSDLRVDERIPDLGSEIFLRPGENKVDRVRSPRPWPRDVLGQIDQKLLEADDLDSELRLMLRFCRWGGPRVSELVALPIDCVKVTRTGGYWVEYWMPKVKRMRRFPIPDVLGEQMVEQRTSVIERLGPDTQLMFPQSKRSNISTQVARPWSSSGFAKRVAELFGERGILASKITGELVSGADIHRFRHTIGTELLNNGWTQHEVMEFLGHASPTMTATYARINDDTLSRKMGEFHKSSPSFTTTYGDADPQVEKMRARITAVTPSGFCTLPASQNCDVRSNPCLSCAFFSKGDGSFDQSRGIYRTQLSVTIVRAEAAGDADIAALNQAILEDLDAMESNS